jgi:hypothetical protein
MFDRLVHHRNRARWRPRLILSVMTLVLLAAPAIASAGQFRSWGPAVPEAEINSPQADGCPIESPNGRELYIASNRPGTLGGNDIWVSHRRNVRSPWSAPVNLGAPVNSEFADFCPTPLGHGWLLFVSERPGPGTCDAGPGKGDIYIVKQRRNGSWGTPRHLGCDAAGSGPNFPGGEFGPSLVHTRQGTFLYFSSDGYGTDMNIYQSRLRRNGSFAPATLVTELNTPSADFMPNVRRDGLEIVFNSNRPGGHGGQDVYSASRRRTSDPWSTPVNLGPNVNTAGNETRSSLSGDGKRLHFGRDGDIYVSARTRGHGHHH